MVFTMPQVERLVGFSRRTIMRWQNEGVFFPDYPLGIDVEGRYRRVFSFKDVVELRTLAKLRREYAIAVDQLKRVGAYLRDHCQSPWTDLRFWVVGGEIVFRDPSSDLLMTGRDLSQVAIELIVLTDIAKSVEAEAEALKTRDPSTLGKVIRHRNIMSNRNVIAGTRIPTSTIWQFHEDGYDTRQIIEEFPDLTQKDIEAAISFEAGLRGVAA
jgi:uncharacterized protein (DUF433 family)